MKSDVMEEILQPVLDCQFRFRGNQHRVRSFNDHEGNLKGVIIDAEAAPLALRNLMLDESGHISSELQEGTPLEAISRRYDIQAGGNLEHVFGNIDVKLACSFWHASMQILKKHHLQSVPQGIPVHNLRVFDGGKA